MSAPPTLSDPQPNSARAVAAPFIWPNAARLGQMFCLGLIVPLMVTAATPLILSLRQPLYDYLLFYLMLAFGLGYFRSLIVVFARDGWSDELDWFGVVRQMNADFVRGIALVATAYGAMWGVRWSVATIWQAVSPVDWLSTSGGPHSPYIVLDFISSVTMLFVVLAGVLAWLWPWEEFRDPRAKEDDAIRPGWQFGLGSLMVVTTLVALVFAAGTVNPALGVFVAAVTLIVAVATRWTVLGREADGEIATPALILDSTFATIGKLVGVVVIGTIAFIAGGYPAFALGAFVYHVVGELCGLGTPVFYADLAAALVACLGVGSVTALPICVYCGFSLFRWPLKMPSTPRATSEGSKVPSPEVAV